MMVLYFDGNVYQSTEYESEADLEHTILIVQQQLFGADRIYLDIKKMIGQKYGLRRIPDGYLIDLAGRNPKLYVVENELSSHDYLRHIAVQILEFSLAFDEAPRSVKSVLYDGIVSDSNIKQRMDDYAKIAGFRNIDNLLDVLIFESPFAALVIIDEIPDRLQAILAEKFHFDVELLEVARFQSLSGDYVYQFEPFLSELSQLSSVIESNSTKRQNLDLDDVDTIIVPGHKDGFEKRFMKETRWYAIRIRGIMRPRLKFIAIYQTSPISAITHIAQIDEIVPYEDTNKFEVRFSETPQKIENISGGERLRHLQNSMYTTIQRLENARTLDDL